MSPAVSETESAGGQEETRPMLPARSALAPGPKPKRSPCFSKLLQRDILTYSYLEKREDFLTRWNKKEVREA